MLYPSLSHLSTVANACTTKEIIVPRTNIQRPDILLHIPADPGFQVVAADSALEGGVLDSLHCGLFGAFAA